MAIPYSTLTTQKPFPVLLAIFITFFLLLAREVNSEEVSFNFTHFIPGSESITLQGGAEILESGILALTNRENPAWNTGRALYATPVRIWDSTTGNVASFVTSFSFVVEDYEDITPADGIIFFIAPAGTQIPDNSAGGKLGVVNGNNAFNQFVGVEFDTYVNTWDPDYKHIGIDVNSLISLQTVKWRRESGSLVEVSIIHDPLSKTLSVSVTFEDGRISTIAQAIDLKAVLPEKVSVGFSAGVSSQREKHDIHSWSFTSNLETNSATDNINIASYA